MQSKGSSEAAPPRGNHQYRSDDALDAALNGLSPPSLKILFWGFYGDNWAKTASLTFARRYDYITKIARGDCRIPRQMLQHLVEIGSDGKATAKFIAGERRRFEARLQKRLERRSAVVRWCRLVLSGAAPSSYRFLERRPPALFRKRAA